MFLYFPLFPFLHLLKICNKKITKHHLINPCFLIFSTDQIKT
nr:MAG TPA: hypothetical protein [Bacteriophage sp.]